MERALRNRLTFGPLMLAAVIGLLVLDSWIERVTESRGWVRDAAQTWGVGGVGLFILLLIILPPAIIELATLFAAEKVKPYRFIAAVGAGLLVLHAFLTQFDWFQ